MFRLCCAVITSTNYRLGARVCVGKHRAVPNEAMAVGSTVHNRAHGFSNAARIPLPRRATTPTPTRSFFYIPQTARYWVRIVRLDCDGHRLGPKART